MTINIQILLLFLLVFGFTRGQRSTPGISYPTNQVTKLNDPCQFAKSGTSGVCKRYSDCESVQTDLKIRRVQPTLCYFDQFDPIVCCKLSDTVEQNQRDKIETLTKSQQFCEKYYNKDETVFRTEAVGGVKAKKGEFPYMAAVGWKIFENEIDFHCGGFLISKNFIITAAHCTSLGGSNPDYARIGGGSLGSTTIDPQVDIPIEKVFIHPNYKSNENYNDIAIMKLGGNSDQLPGCLWQTEAIRPRFDTAEAVGYGHTEFAGARSNDLIKVKLKIYTNELCSTVYKQNAENPQGIINSQLCAGDPNGVMDTCQGDSGGPILVQSGTIPYIIGITSFGDGCAKGTPSIYTRISSYLGWIESIVWP